jgi:hypothetical protein
MPKGRNNIIFTQVETREITGPTKITKLCNLNKHFSILLPLQTKLMTPQRIFYQKIAENIVPRILPILPKIWQHVMGLF